MFSRERMRMPGGTCFGLLFAAVLCLCVVHSAEGQVTKICFLGGGYDINTLRSVPYWTVRVDSKFICPLFNNDKNKECVMYLSFCQMLPDSGSDPAGFCRHHDTQINQPRNASVCMVIDGNLGNETTATFGQYLPQVEPFRAIDIKDGKTGFESISEEGKGFASTCTQTQSFVQFRCDPTANWTTVENNNVTKYLISAGFETFAPCFFTMNLAYAGACVAVPLPTSSPGTDPGIVGFVLICVLLAAVVTYLVVGSVINLALGKRHASDVFPNYAFWVGFPFLLLDGLRFSFNLVTCYSCTKESSPLSGQAKSKTQYETLP